MNVNLGDQCVRGSLFRSIDSNELVEVLYSGDSTRQIFSSDLSGDIEIVDSEQQDDTPARQQPW